MKTLKQSYEPATSGIRRVGLSRILRGQQAPTAVVLIVALIALAGCGTSATVSTGSSVSGQSDTSAPTTTSVASPSTSIPPSTVLGTATYGDPSGDTVKLSLSSFPVVRSISVPADVAQACEDGPNGNGEFEVDRSLFRQLNGTIEVTSSLMASIQLQFIGNGLGPIEQNVVHILSSGPQCNGNSDFGFSGSPGPISPFTIWLVYPNVLTPTQPDGDPTVLADSAWAFPSLDIANTDSGEPTSVSGPGVIQCGGVALGVHASRYFPSGTAMAC